MKGCSLGMQISIFFLFFFYTIIFPEEEEEEVKISRV